MDPTKSVSKGCFVFKNGASRAEIHTNKLKKTTPFAKIGGTEQPFYEAFSETWKQFSLDIQTLKRERYIRTLKDLISYIKDANYSEPNILPAVALLTGINQSDHYEQFDALSEYITEKLSSSACIIQSRDCFNLKSAIETMVYGFVGAPIEINDRNYKRLRRYHYTMEVLNEWYKRCNKKNNLVVILPDFECFNPEVVVDLILILSSYCAKIPMALVIGVATSEQVLHSTLPYHVTNKIRLKIFQTGTAPTGLNEILEKVISPKYSFHLSGKAFKLLTHIFLFYDFSINGFIQSFKYCLMEHFFRGNVYSLCVDYDSSLRAIKQLTHEDMEHIRRMLSFRPYVEGLQDCKKVILILTDDGYLRKKLPQLLRECHLHFLYFRIFLEFLTNLVHDLPNAPLGKLKRELYAKCLVQDITETYEFKEAWQMLSLMSKDEFVKKVSDALTATIQFFVFEVRDKNLAKVCRPAIDEKINAIKELLTVVVAAAMDTKADFLNTPDISYCVKPVRRQDLKEQLLQISKQKEISDFTKSLNAILEFTKENVVKEFLKPLSKSPPLHELYVFSDIRTVKRYVIGAPRAALHLALNNPNYYLACKCCDLTNIIDIRPTFPDLSIAYKLHLECGKMINLFDLLQAFLSVVDYNAKCDQVNPKIQARFARVIAELQFLGFIKTSKRKTDHVTKLTW